MATTTPYGNPNWFKRQNRLSVAKEPKQMDVNDPEQMARMMYGAGLQMGADGSPKPTRDFGSLLRLNSSQMNPLSRGAKPGSFSSLGQPMNSMYANNPGFFNREGSNNFAGQIAQRNTALTPGAPVSAPTQRTSPMDPDTPGGASALARSNMMNRPVDKALLEKRGFGSPMQPAPSGVSVTPAAPAAPNTGLQDRAAGLRLLREMSQTPLQIERSGGETRLQGKYGTGWSAPTTPGKQSQGLINGRPVAEVMQGLAEKPGLARPGDKYQPKGMTADEVAKARKIKK